MDILNGSKYRIECGECLDWLRALPDSCVDLVVCSPPYEAQRTYSIGFNLAGADWVCWAADRFVECCRVSKGLVVWVVEGKTKNYVYSATPILLMAELHRRGVRLRKPPIYHRQGIPGSGGLDWWRNDYEFCICASNGKLPWAEPKAIGKPCKYITGGAFSYRTQDGKRINESKHNAGSKAANGKSRGRPDITNPGNVIKCKVGGGLMGSDLSHENEAPFPESLVEPFVRCFAPPNGIVCDIFSGSGTTAAVALKWNRRFLGCDVRQSQVDLTKRRIAEVQPMLIS